MLNKSFKSTTFQNYLLTYLQYIILRVQISFYNLFIVNATLCNQNL